ncbi:kinase [Niveispirillum sp. BGYR6]|uniref:GHMP family kinase ATP-binding protein n=1 Tax=Niveispirillum sp. BGYR6 TaxID=2971249 RepID=UPI0022B97F48|nr:kinase [Niveispirillum sp. BGYR6]MDG5497430.1 kinase [Niveispirillum sp. BGYR6]
MMIMSRTPLRVSFFGGGTDYPEYFRQTGRRGAVLGMAIDKYIYISALRLSGIQPYRYRLSYSRLETVVQASDIQHNVVRVGLSAYDVKDDLDISIMSDMPASTGLGSSSSFTVGFVNLLSALQGRARTKLDLATEAIRIERDLLQERVGVQDQLHAAFGGINRFDFDANGFSIRPVAMGGECLQALCSSLLLIYTGQTRHASATLDEQIQKTTENKVDRELSDLLALVDQGMDLLQGHDPDQVVRDFGAMMHEGWKIKRSLSSKISSGDIDTLYEVALRHGALGGKLCGAGGGGFLLMVVPPARQQAVIEAVAPARVVPAGLDTLGSCIVMK